MNNCEYNQQYCLTNLKAAKRLDINDSQPQRNYYVNQYKCLLKVIL